nr:putative ribonuclease H-like domain-containing protein [Tanacetum cinerariifolium]
AYSDSDYVGASLDRRSITEGCQFLGCRIISWQCKKKTVVATSSAEAEYVAATSCCAQVLWIQNQLLDYGKKVIIIEDTVRQALRLDDAKSIDCLSNEEIFTKLARMGSSMASAVICLATVADVIIADDVADVFAHAATEPTQPSPTPTTTPLQPQDLPSTS